MSCITCGGRSVWATISRAAAKSAGDRLRRLGAAATHASWPVRAGVCEMCPIRVVRGGVSYCGKPFLSQIAREPEEGCGCPVNAKAKDPKEHCPLDNRHRRSGYRDGKCTCKWCSTPAPAGDRQPNV